MVKKKQNVMGKPVKGIGRSLISAKAIASIFPGGRKECPNVPQQTILSPDTAYYLKAHKYLQ
jgi:hypothetical protein